MQRQPRAKGEVRLSVQANRHGTGLAGLRQSGSLRMLFPRVPRPQFQGVLINTAGGITGGDVLGLTAKAGAATRLTLTTQAAERAYLARPGETARLCSRLTVGDGARIDWLPQETILFNGCDLVRSLSVEMSQGASLLLVEPLVFGRAAMGEKLTLARFRDRIEIRRQGRAFYLDAMTLKGDITAHLARPAIANGAGAMACIVYVAPDAAARLGQLRPMLPETAGASLIGADLLAARILAPDSHDLRQSLIPILNHLSDDTLPRSWMT